MNSLIDKNMETRRNYSTGVNIIRRFLFAFAYILPIFTFFGGTLAAIISILELCIILVLFFDDEFYLLAPVLIFFYLFLVAPGGIVIYRGYTVLFLFKMVFQKKKLVYTSYLGVFIVVFFYCLTVLVPYNFRLGIAAIFDMIFTIVYISNCFKTPEKIIKFFKYFTLAALSAGIFGMMRQSMQFDTSLYIHGELVSLSRMIATFIDPNYLGFFFNIAIFSNLILKLFQNKIVRILSVSFLYYILIATLSITGILCNVIGLLLYLFLVKRMRLQYLLAFICLIPIIMFVFQYSLQKNIPYISDFVIRSSSMMEQDKTDLAGITSNRSVLWDSHWDYFKNQSVIKIFFGGNRIAPISLDDSQFTAVSHQEYLDELLNVGIIGLVVMMVYLLSSIVKRFKRYLHYKDNTEWAILFVKYVWIFYGFGLTMFLDSKFTLFLLM